MFELTVKGGFSAAHSLREYEGPCERLHGHNYKLDVVLCGEQLNELGLLIDFKVVKAALAEVLGPLDHQVLNEVEPFDSLNPTAENIARHVYQELSERMPQGVCVKSITAWESDGCGATYLP